MAKRKAKRRCKGKNAQGKPCGARPMRPGTKIEGVEVTGEHCRTHDPNLPESSRFGSHAQAREAAKLAGRPRMPKPSEVARRLIEQNEIALQRPYWRTLGFDVKIGDDGPYLVELEDGGAKIYGESKEGHINVSPHEDLEAMQRAAERLQDRVYGKPKQATEITGADGGPVELVPVKRENAGAVAGILDKVGSGDEG